MELKDLQAEIGKEFIRREQLSAALQESNGKIQALYAKLQEQERKEEGKKPSVNNK